MLAAGRPVTVALLLVAPLGCGSEDEPSPRASPEQRPPERTERPSPEVAAELGEKLTEAARGGDLEATRELLARGADVTVRDDAGATALVVAAYGGHVDVARELIEAGADPDAKDETQQSAYLIAASEDHPELLELALDNGARVNSKDSFNGTALIRAAERGNVEVVRRLLRTSIDRDHVNELGWTALMEAVIRGPGDERHTETVRLLVEDGVDLNEPDDEGVTPLAHARALGYDEIAEILEEAGAQG
jgi:uncharacterized protein